jgi:hypothetical protein
MNINTSKDVAVLDSGSPVKVFVRTASLGSSALRFLRDRGAEFENGPIIRVLSDKFERGLYEA